MTNQEMVCPICEDATYYYNTILERWVHSPKPHYYYNHSPVVHNNKVICENCDGTIYYSYSPYSKRWLHTVNGWTYCPGQSSDICEEATPRIEEEHVQDHVDSRAWQ